MIGVIHKEWFAAHRRKRQGISPLALLKAYGLELPEYFSKGYNPDEPRVPAGNGSQSGEWTGGGYPGSLVDTASGALADLEAPEQIIDDPKMEIVRQMAAEILRMIGAESKVAI